jgi:O-antigen/teichoic acid export membrane protein
LDRLLAEAFFESPQNAQYVSLCGFVIATSLVLNIIRNWYRVEDRAEIYATINILQSGMGMVLGIAVAAAKSSVYNLVLLTTLFEAILSLVSLVCIFRRYGIGSPSWHVLKRYAGYGLPLMPAGYAMWILNASDRIFIVHYGNLSDLGVYSAVYSLGYVFISVCFNPIWTMYPARAAELYNTGELEDLNSLFRYSTKTALALLVPIMAGFAVLANPVVHVFSTDEFVRGASLVPIITLGYVFHMMGSYWEISLWLAKRPGLATVNILWASASNILLNFLLVPTWGITGAALATAFSFAIQMLLNVWRGSSCVRLRFDWPFLGKVMLSAGFMALAVRQFQSESIPVLLGSVVAGAGIYAAGLIALRSFSATEGQALLGLLHMQWTARYRLVRLLVGIR